MATTSLRIISDMGESVPGRYEGVLRAGATRTQEDFEHVEAGELHLGDDDGRKIDFGILERGAEHRSGQAGGQDVCRHAVKKSETEM